MLFRPSPSSMLKKSTELFSGNSHFGISESSRPSVSHSMKRSSPPNFNICVPLFFPILISATSPQANFLPVPHLSIAVFLNKKCLPLEVSRTIESICLSSIICMRISDCSLSSMSIKITSSARTPAYSERSFTSSSVRRFLPPLYFGKGALLLVGINHKSSSFVTNLDGFEYLPPLQSLHLLVFPLLKLSPRTRISLPQSHLQIQ